MKKILPLLLLSCMTANAQSVKTDFDKKVIFSDSLNISKANSATIVLSMLPELLNRPGVNFASGYAITIEGMSVGDVGDAALAQLHLSDIEKIEVIDSPIADYQSNGQGGTINIMLRRRSTPEKPFYGSASLDGSYPLDIYPQLYMGYKTNKFFIRGLVLGEWYKTSKDVETNRYSGTDFHAEDATNKTNFLSELVRVYTEYTPTDKDVIRFNVSENASHVTLDAQTTILNANVSSFAPQYQTITDVSSLGAGFSSNVTSNSRTKNITTFQSLLNYKHTFNPHSTFIAEVQYVFNPNHVNKNFPSIQLFENRRKSHQISGKVEYKVNLVPLSNKKGNYSDLTIGVNGNKTFLRDNIELTDLSGGFGKDTTFSQQPRSGAFHIMPYLTSESKIGKLRVKATFEFQHYEYDMNGLETPYTNDRNDFTGKLMAEWHFTPHKNLRLIVNRTLQRPTDEQVYPVRTYRLERQGYVQGKADLLPVLSHEFSLNYISDYKWGEHSLVLDVAASYNNVDDIITEYRDKSSGTGFYYQSEYVTFRNDGTNHIINGDFMAIWQYRFLNVAFTANVFNNKQNVADDSNHYTNYNLSLTPSFNLTHGWKTSLNVCYFSKVSRKYETLGDYASASLSVSKSWGNLKAYIFGRVALTSKTTNTKTQPSDDETVNTTQIVTRANLQQNKVGAGVMYVF